jgi:hypothetical protein
LASRAEGLSKVAMLPDLSGPDLPQQYRVAGWGGTEGSEHIVDFSQLDLRRVTTASALKSRYEPNRFRLIDQVFVQGGSADGCG